MARFEFSWKRNCDKEEDNGPIFAGLNIMHVVQWFYKLFERTITELIESNSLRASFK